MLESLKQIVKDIIPYKIHEELFPKPEVFLVDTHLGEPNIYNSSGQKMRVIYLQDRLGAHLPYASITSLPQKILWDRYNYTLPIHFYGSQDVSGIRGNPQKKYAWFTESEAIDGASYDRIFKETALANSFDAIFTFSERLLNRYTNAKFIPAMQTWYGSIMEGGEYDPLRYEKKTKSISMICSSKILCEWHRKRNFIAEQIRNSKKADVFGSFTGTFLRQKAEALDGYRYSIVVENDITPFYFTEKILDCFGAMTVPIYIGASRIGDFFNIDGIIVINPNDYTDLDKILAICSPKDYESRKEAIIDNYHRVQQYLNVEDYFFKHYFSCFEI
nr:glycosyltransferase family 10 [uncultured Sphaerochaeta sp.]